MKKEKKPLAPFSLVRNVTIEVDVGEEAKTFTLHTRTLRQKEFADYKRAITQDDPNPKKVAKARRQLDKLDRKIARVSVRRQDLADLIDALRGQGEGEDAGEHDERVALTRRRAQYGEDLAVLEAEFAERREEFERMFPQRTDDEKHEIEEANARRLFDLLVESDPDGFAAFVESYDLSWEDVIGYVQARIEEEKGNASAG